MKRVVSLILVLLMAISLVACGSDRENREDSVAGTQESASKEVSGQERTLVAYFSWADNVSAEGGVDAVTSPSVIKPGDVAQLASWIQEESNGELFSIQVTEPYSSDWDNCLERANEERSDNARPELKERVGNISDYDVVFLGYPNWWYGAPMALLSFIEENDLSGKQIYLFCSHGTGGLAESVDDIKSVLPQSAVLSENIFDVSEEEADGAQKDIVSWLKGIGY